MMLRACLLLLALAAPVAAQPTPPAAPSAGTPSAPPAATPENRTLARALVQSMGMQALVETMVSQMRDVLVAAMQQSTPNVAPAEIAKLADELLLPELRARSGEVLEFSADYWGARLTAPELRELTTFYASPLGKKMLALLPDVSAQAMRFGQEWGQRAAGAAIEKHRAALRARGLNL